MRNQHGGHRKPGRALEHAQRVAQILIEQIEVDEQRVAGDFGDRAQPERDSPQAAGVAEAAREERPHLGAVLVPERRRVETKQQVVRAHHAFPGASPLARAILTSCASRRASSFAAAMPSGVIR
jgi:hypothetical protein